MIYPGTDVGRQVHRERKQFCLGSSVQFSSTLSDVRTTSGNKTAIIKATTQQSKQ